MNNSVELLGWYGGDREHALSAWTSTSRELTPEKEKRIPAMLRFLATNGHHTPFEKSSLHFLVTCDIASHIHLLKHRVGVSVNAESARYRELKDKSYVPWDWPQELREELEKANYVAYKKYHRALETLISNGFDRKRAKESARYFLPYSNMITSDVMFNFRSFMHFQGLRNKEDAQLEIRIIAEEMMGLVKDTGAFNHSIEAFKET